MFKYFRCSPQQQFLYSPLEIIPVIISVYRAHSVLPQCVCKHNRASKDISSCLKLKELPYYNKSFLIGEKSVQGPVSRSSR